MGSLDIPLSLYQAAGSSNQLVCHVAASPLRIVRAMARHRSQWIWWVLASRFQHVLVQLTDEKWSTLAEASCLMIVHLPCRFRKLFMAFSRYTYVNTLQRIDI